MWRPTVSSDELMHSRGPWKNHKYKAIVNGRYVYDNTIGAAKKAIYNTNLYKNYRLQQGIKAGRARRQAKLEADPAYRQKRMREADDARARKVVKNKFKSVSNLIGLGKQKVSNYLEKLKTSQRVNSAMRRRNAAVRSIKRGQAIDKAVNSVKTAYRVNSAKARRNAAVAGIKGKQAIGNAVNSVKTAYRVNSAKARRNAAVAGIKGKQTAAKVSGNIRKTAGNAASAAKKTAYNTKLYKGYRQAQGVKAGRKRYAARSARVKKNRKWSKIVR